MIVARETGERLLKSVRLAPRATSILGKFSWGWRPRLYALACFAREENLSISL